MKAAVWVGAPPEDLAARQLRAALATLWIRWDRWYAITITISKEATQWLATRRDNGRTIKATSAPLLNDAMTGDYAQHPVAVLDEDHG